ncbi:MAG: hypothetical protein ACRDX8_15400 [Acidimicrobiales bacterium]
MTCKMLGGPCELALATIALWLATASLHGVFLLRHWSRARKGIVAAARDHASCVGD